MYGRDYSKFTDDGFRDDVSIQPWLQQVNDPNLLMGDFVWRLDGCTERHAPMKKLSPHEIKLKIKPWINRDIQKLIKVRDKLFARKKGSLTMKELGKHTMLFETELPMPYSNLKKSIINLTLKNKRQILKRHGMVSQKS